MDDREKSLNDEATFAGAAKRRPAAEMSLGDERTLGDRLAEQDTVIDDIEVVDLEARYKVEGTLGQGGMGAVLLATDTRLGRKVAIKRILGEAARSKTAIMRFLTEAKAIAALNHPNIVQIYDYGWAKDGPFLTMEYVDGGSLLDRCREGALPLEDAVDLACQLCDGLAKAHDAGIVHRDIKPANVLLTKDGIPKLTDFGLAKAQASDHGQTMTGAVLGTPDFMPPEQRRDASLVDHRSDLWSLAATIYQMVTGRSPKVIRLHELPHSLQAVISRALEDAKDTRYQSARQFRDAIRTMATDSHEGSGFATPHADDDVQDGKCTACGTVNSDVSRKFCKKCGQGLRNACLKCDAQIPVWEAICGECGANQPQLLANMRVTLDRKRLRAERLAESGSCEEAIVLAREIAAVTHPHLSDVASWAVSFARDQAEELERQNTFAVRQLAEAQQYASARHDAAAIAAIELIPHPMRDSDAQTLLATCMARRDADRREHAITIQGIATQLQRSTYRIAEQIEARITDLESKQTAADVILEIKERVRTKEIDGLIPQVRRAIAMGGDPPALQKLLTQLMDRRNTKINEARVAFNAGSARSAAAKTAILRFEDLDAADRQFVEQARHAGHLEDQIVALVKNARSGDGVSQQQVWNMLGLSTEFLAINPHNEQIYSLLQRCKNALPKPLRNSVGIAMQQIPAGSFTMDDPDLRHYGESHRVALSQSFFIGVYTVTNAQWARLMGSVPSRCKDDDLPVEAVSWEAAVEFCKKLSALPEERKAGRVYRLPTTEEWEYACRGGTTTDYSFGSDASRLGDYGWYRGNAGGQTQPVGLKTPNPCGLYDMHGNVWEWSSTRQQRGGCYDCVPEDCRSGCSYRGSTHRIKKVGFRLALDVPKGSPQQASR